MIECPLVSSLIFSPNMKNSSTTAIFTYRTKICQDLDAVPGVPNFFQVVNHPDNQSDEHIIQTCHLCCSCNNFRYGTTCPYFGMHKMTDHALNLKRTHIAIDDEKVKN